MIKKQEGAVEKRAMGNLVKPVLNILSAVGAALKKARIRAVRAFDSSATAFYLKKLRESIPYLKNSVIGAFLLTFGIYSSLIAVFKLTFASGGSIEDVFVSLSAAVISLPLLFSRGTVGTLLTLSQTGALIAKAIGMRVHLNFSKAAWGRSNIAFLLGMLFGSATFILSPLQVMVFVAAAVAASVIFTYPEAAALLLAIVFPLGDGRLFSLIALWGIFSLAVKIFRGKRSVSFHHHRAAVMILLFIVFVSELFKGDFRFTLMMLPFFILSASDGHGDRAEQTVSVAVAACGCIAAAYMAFAGVSVFGNVEADFSAFNIQAMALMCAALVPLAISYMLGKTGLPAQTAFLCSIAMIGFLVYNGYYMYLLASLAGIILFLFFYRRRASYAVFAVACAAYAIWVWMGGSNRIAVDHLMSFLKELGIAYDAGWLYILIGGNIEGSFGASESFYGAVISKLGVIGLAVLVCAAVLLFGYILREKHGKGEDKSSATYMRAWAPASSAIVLFICGLGTNVWAYDGVFALFWILMGASSAIAADAESKSMRSAAALINSWDKTKAEIIL